MALAGLLPDICEDHPTAEDGNILFFLRKIVSNDLEIKMEACMRAIHEMLSFVQNISSNS